MSKFDKFKHIFEVAAPVAEAFLPGGAGTALGSVKSILNGMPSTAMASPAAAESLKTLATDNDEQTAAILSIFDYVQKLEARILELERVDK